MTTTKTADVDGTLAQIYALAAAGCDIVRCTCNEEEAAEGDALLRQGRIVEAFGRYEAILKTKPDAAPTLNNFAWALSTAHDPSLRDGRRALTLAQRAALSWTTHHSPLTTHDSRISPIERSHRNADS